MSRSRAAILRPDLERHSASASVAASSNGSIAISAAAASVATSTSNELFGPSAIGSRRARTSLCTRTWSREAHVSYRKSVKNSPLTSAMALRAACCRACQFPLFRRSLSLVTSCRSVCTRSGARPTCSAELTTYSGLALPVRRIDVTSELKHGLVEVVYSRVSIGVRPKEVYGHVPRQRRVSVRSEYGEQCPDSSLFDFDQWSPPTAAVKAQAAEGP